MMRWILPLLLAVSRVFAQPAPPVRLAAEWEPSYGTLIRWPLGIPSSLVVELARDDSLYVLVANGSEQAEAQATFTSWGVNLAHCRFLHIPTYSHWTRDWGPHWAFDGQGVCGIVDPFFDGYPWGPGGPYREYQRGRGYEVDDLVNQALGVQLECPVWQFPGYLTGGNFMNDGHGIGYSALSMLTENMAFYSHAEFLALAEPWLGLSDYRIVINPEEYGLQHIDCAAKLLNEETILLKQVSPGHPDHARLTAIHDRLTTEMSIYGRPYNVVPIFCGSYSGNAVAAYTNSYILNNKVFVPLFNIASDGPAIETYQNAMPGYEIIGIPWSAWYYYDALHCRTREMTDRQMLLIQHRPLDPEVSWQPGIPVSCRVRAYSGAPLIPAQTVIRHREAGAGDWQTVPLVPSGSDSLEGLIPAYPVDAVVEYYLTAADQSGRSEAHPRPAPAAFHSFTVVQGTGLEREGSAWVAGASAFPNPFRNSLVLSFTVALSGPVSIRVFDLVGREVRALYQGEPAPGIHTVHWDGRDPSGGRVPPGTYLVSVISEEGGKTLRVLFLP